jgi:hypothetical protein
VDSTECELDAERRNQIARINRQLAKRNEKLHFCSRGAAGYLGAYYIVDVLQNKVIEFRVDPDLVEDDLQAERHQLA